MVTAGVIEGRQALDAETHLSPDDPHVTDEPGPLPRVRYDRHEVERLGQALGREVAGQEHVRVGQVELVAVGVLHGPQRELPAFFVVEDGAEHARRVEGGQAQPVYGTVGADQRRRMQVPDDTVVLDGEIPHPGLPSQRRRAYSYLTAPRNRHVSTSARRQASPVDSSALQRFSLRAREIWLSC